MTSYVRYTKEQIEYALPGGWQIHPADVHTWEIVYCWIGERWVLYCFSAVDRRTNISRPKGSDAIRFALVDKVSGKGVGAATRVHRSGTEHTLANRMADRYKHLMERAVEENKYRCKKCGAATVERMNKKKEKFRGCLRWPECGGKNENSKQLVSVEETQGRVHGVRASEKIDGAVSDREEIIPEMGANASIPSETFPLLAFPFRYFNPVQCQAFPFVNEDVNLVVASPTSSGKTVVAEMAMAVSLDQGKKAVFLSPLKAVTQEKYDEWHTRWLDLETFRGLTYNPQRVHKLFAFHGRRIEIVTGDYMLTARRVDDLRAADIILLTSEMLDSRTRRMEKERNTWLYEVGCLVCDEAHLLTMEGRGHALESGIMRFTQQNPKARVILLSASMSNVDDLGRWLTLLNGKPTEIVKSDWRPVPHQVHFVPYHDRGRYGDIESAKVNQALELIETYAHDKILAFAHTKATGRMLLRSLEDVGIEAEFHSADVDRANRLRIEKSFRER